MEILELEKLKKEFINIFETNIHREGGKDLLDWILNSDFFEAPASTRYHLNEKGGLLLHSINVYHNLIQEYEFMKSCHPEMKDYSLDCLALVALCHDLCKCNFYSIEMRNAKDEFGQWIKVPYYTIDDTFPLGHGEKSMYIVQSFVKLSGEEALSLRWHMGGFDDAVKGGSYSQSQAFSKCPLAVLLHIADMKATYFNEV